jgi:hypothetical protein
MPLRIAADFVLLAHLAFIVFVMLGGLLVLRWRRLTLLHLPAVAWAVFVEAAGIVCPLTFVENALRVAAGAAGYRESFVEHYLLGVIYPDGLSRPIQYVLAVIVVGINAAIYARLLRGRRPGHAMEAR